MDTSKLKTIDKKERYRQFYKNHTGPSYLHPDFLNLLVGEERWGVALYSKNETIKAACPYVYSKLKHWKTILPVPLLPYTKAIYEPFSPQSTIQKIHKNEKRIWEGLLADMPNLAVVHFKLYPNYVHPVFQWRGCKIRMAHTSILDISGSIEDIWAGFSSKLRSDIRYASQRVEVRHNDLNSFLSGYQQHILKRKIPNLLSVEKLEYVLTRSGDWVQFDTWAAMIEGKIVSTILVLFDSDCAYYLVSSNAKSPSYRGANSLLLWKAIQAAQSSGINKFDFEGSMLPEIQTFFNSFNPQIMPYASVYRYKSKGHRLVFEWLKNP